MYKRMDIYLIDNCNSNRVTFVTKIDIQYKND